MMWVAVICVNLALAVFILIGIIYLSRRSNNSNDNFVSTTGDSSSRFSGNAARRGSTFAEEQASRRFGTTFPGNPGSLKVATRSPHAAVVEEAEVTRFENPTFIKPNHVQYNPVYSDYLETADPSVQPESNNAGYLDFSPEPIRMHSNRNATNLSRSGPGYLDVAPKRPSDSGINPEYQSVAELLGDDHFGFSEPSSASYNPYGTLYTSLDGEGNTSALRPAATASNTYNSLSHGISAVDGRPAWLHGAMSRIDAEETLLSDGRSGVFLVRERDKPKEWTLSLMINQRGENKFAHHIIEQGFDGVLCIQGTAAPNKATTLTDFVSFLRSPAHTRAVERLVEQDLLFPILCRT